LYCIQKNDQISHFFQIFVQISPTITQKNLKTVFFKDFFHTKQSRRNLNGRMAVFAGIDMLYYIINKKTAKFRKNFNFFRTNHSKNHITLPKKKHNLSKFPPQKTQPFQISTQKNATFSNFRPKKRKISNFQPKKNATFSNFR